jgi:hypothetical protein
MWQLRRAWGGVMMPQPVRVECPFGSILFGNMLFGSILFECIVDGGARRWK